MAFDHERLEVYRKSIQFTATANEAAAKLPRGRGYLADQLQRAALSIVLNIAEGAGKFSPADKAAFYLRARASATESAAVMDVASILQLLNPEIVTCGKAQLEEIARMLTRMIKNRQNRA
ncbi:MAG: four helix bundle protein [Thermoanaerobaculia bacterium]|nr:four helix bundle protein [Thermoanaerobaculia bacterium]